MEKKCEVCGIDYKTYKKAQKFCSNTCSQSIKKLPTSEKTCEFSGCNNTFIICIGGARTQKFCSTNCQKEWQQFSQLGKNNGNYGRENKWGNHDETRRKLISEKVKETWETEERMVKHMASIEKYKNINGYYALSSPEARRKNSEHAINRMLLTNHLTTYKTCKRGYYLNNKSNELEYYHSSWEENRMNELDLDDNVIKWTKKHNIIIKYKHDGIIKSYLPDFYIEYKNGVNVLEEVKGYISDIPMFILKKEAAEDYCDKNNMIYKINFMKNYERYKNLIYGKK